MKLVMNMERGSRSKAIGPIFSTNFGDVVSRLSMDITEARQSDVHIRQR